MRRDKHSKEKKELIIDAFSRGDDWRVVARIIKVKEKTAYTWIARFKLGTLWGGIWGGSRGSKMHDFHVEYLTELLGDNPKFTLKMMAESLQIRFGLVVCQQTVKNNLEGACFTLKQTHVKPEYMNKPENKEKRRNFLIQLQEYVSLGGKTAYYMDETNFNLWTSRSMGWSKKGERAVQTTKSGGRQNIQVLACIGENGLVHYDTRFGSNNMITVNAFFVDLLRKLCQRHPRSEVLVVVDNAPAHNDLESVFAMDEFAGTTLLRLGPYSPMLNPIENCFSVFKAGVKRFFVENRDEVLVAPLYSTMAEHRRTMLLQAVEANIHEAATPEKCRKYFSHTVQFHHKVYDLQDMPVGK
ncbi:hypothetical protein DYB32_005539 [Aphanomyces invadans]|uniref:Tc1-like transposase DDE domain-containing protein n=1 Tax=Aphanomyces invadans TaxID=157072 RepID=A0A418AU92_9STRA|nr:hypothetical protein DYB32_005539 [Aphanomyces invadans]